MKFSRSVFFGFYFKLPPKQMKRKIIILYFSSYANNLQSNQLTLDDLRKVYYKRIWKFSSKNNNNRFQSVDCICLLFGRYIDWWWSWLKSVWVFVFSHSLARALSLSLVLFIFRKSVNQFEITWMFGKNLPNIMRYLH